LVRDALIPVIWLRAYTAGGYEWRGNRISIAGAGTAALSPGTAQRPAAGGAQALWQRPTRPSPDDPYTTAPPAARHDWRHAMASTAGWQRRGRQNPACDVTRVKCEAAMLPLALRSSRITTFGLARNRDKHAVAD
jgi:hypothetical protein